MVDLLGAATRVLSRAQSEVELAAFNLANLTTPGFKRAQAFNAHLNKAEDRSAANDLRPGPLLQTHNPLDVAIAAEGYFELQAPDGPRYTRAGQFHRLADGRLASVEGFPVQSVEGGDLVLRSDNPVIMADGTVLEGDHIAGTLKLVSQRDLTRIEMIDGRLMRAAETNAPAMEGVTLRQGMLESSNVETTDEMVRMMLSVRQAQSAQRVIQTYDDLMGRALKTFE